MGCRCWARARFGLPGAPLLGWRAFFTVVLRKLCAVFVVLRNLMQAAVAAVICTCCCGLRWETAVDMRTQVTHRSQVQWNR